MEGTAKSHPEGFRAREFYRLCGLCGPLFEYRTLFIVRSDSL